MLVGADIASLKVAGCHHLQFGVLLLASFKSRGGVINQVGLNEIVSFDINTTFALHHQHIGFMVSPHHIQSDTVVLGNRTDGVDHIDMGH